MSNSLASTITSAGNTAGKRKTQGVKSPRAQRVVRRKSGTNDHSMTITSGSKSKVPRQPSRNSRGGTGAIAGSPPLRPQPPSAGLPATAMSTANTSFLAGTNPQIVELRQMDDFTSHLDPKVTQDLPLFEAIPSEVFIHDYKGLQQVTATISLRNKDAVSRRVTIEPPKSRHFHLSAPHRHAQASSRVAPGMEVKYTLVFKPEDARDYQYDLVVTTERERFLLPVRCVGERSKLDLPKELLFGIQCPVNAATVRPMLLRNVGKAATSYHIETQMPFSASPQDGVLDVGASAQVLVTFFPKAVGRCASSLVVNLPQGVKQRCELLGAADQADVYLSNPVVEMPETFINLTAQRTVELRNDSDVPVRFDWRSAMTPEEDDAWRDQAHDELRVMEAHERSRMEEEFANQEDEDYAYMPQGGDGNLRRLQADQAIVRKYRNLHRSVEEDARLFSHPIYSISPLSGEIYPRGVKTITVVFQPAKEMPYPLYAYCDVNGRAERLPLELLGAGEGPQAAFSYEVLDIGEVYINTVHHYDVIIRNVGQISCPFKQLQRPAGQSSRFTFSPSHGVLDTVDGDKGQQGSQQLIRVDFSSPFIGEFNETFEWELQGRKEPLRITFKGRSIGPTFSVDKKLLEFGVTSYGFTHTQSLTLRNTSQIPMKFTWRVPTDDEGEFMIVPSTGVVLAAEALQIKINLRPENTRANAYARHNVLLDVEGVGTGLIVLPVQAECKVAPLRIVNDLDSIDFGDVFIRHPHTRVFELINDSDLPAKFVMQQQNESYKQIAVVEAQNSARVEPGCRYQVEVSVTAQRLGQLNLPITLRVPGSSAPALVVMVSANCVGPTVQIGPTSLDFGKVPVLKPIPKSVTVTNTSPIPAEYTGFMKKNHSVFSIEPPTGVIQPYETKQLEVVAYLEDTLAQTDSMHFRVREGDDLNVDLKAKGMGTTASADAEQDMSRIDAGDHFTSKPYTTTFTLTNRGRRSQVLMWDHCSQVEYADLLQKKAQKKLLMKQKADASLAKTKRMASANSSPNVRNRGLEEEKFSEEEELERERVEKAKAMSLVGYRCPKTAKQHHDRDLAEAKFDILPRKVALEPNTAVTFTVRGFVTHPGAIDERWICRSLVGKDKEMEIIYETMLCGNFVSPLLKMSKSRIDFRYLASATDPKPSEPQTLEVVNTSSLPLNVVAHVPSRFSVEPAAFALEPGANVTLEVDFEAELSENRVSTITQGELMFHYKEHPQKDHLPLAGQVCFPNLEFEGDSIDFGCVLNETRARITRTMTNNSKLPVEYNWALTQPAESEAMDQHSGKKGRAKASQLVPMDRAPEVFDVCPIRGRLEPGESQDIEFVFFGAAEAKAQAHAVCEVVGGPHYEVQLKGKASAVSYSLASTDMNFGDNELELSRDKEIILTNNGKVEFDFHIDTSSLETPGVLQIIPSSGKLLSGAKQRIRCRYNSILPDTIKERVWLTVAFFEPVPVDILARGVFPQFSATLPRSEPVDPSWDGLLVKAKKLLAEREAEAEEERQSQLMVTHAQLDLIDPATHGLQMEERPVDDQESPRSPRSRGSSAAPTRTQTGVLTRGESMHSRNVSRGQSRGESAALAPRGSFMRTASSRGRSTGPEEQAPLWLETPPPPPALLKYNPDVLVHLEADRLSYLDFMSQQLEMAITSGSGPSFKSNSKKVAPNFTIAKYDVDFHNVVLGQRKTTTFTLTNTGALPAGLDVDRKTMLGSVFTIEPQQVSRLMPGQSVNFTCTCITNDKHHKKGDMALVVPVTVRDGPSMRLRFKCHINVPNVALSTEKLDFDNLQIGLRKELVVSLTNTEAVACDWSLGKIIGATTRDPDFFEVTPSYGTLQAGKMTTITVAFTPREMRKCMIKLPIKVSMASKVRSIVCRGSGVRLKMEIAPKVCELGPVMPYVRAKPTEILLKNPTPYDIEVYSLDFDKQYLEEEKILSLESYDENGILFTEPRVPGAGLPLQVLDRYRARMRAASAAAAKAAEAAEAEAASEVTQVKEKASVNFDASSKPAASQSTAADPAASTAGESESQARSRGASRPGTTTAQDPDAVSSPIANVAEEVGDVILAASADVDTAIESEPEEHQMTLNIVLTGGPMSGRSAAVSELGAKLGLSHAIATMDQLLAHFYELDSDDKKSKSNKSSVKIEDMVIPTGTNPNDDCSLAKLVRAGLDNAYVQVVKAQQEREAALAEKSGKQDAKKKAASTAAKKDKKNAISIPDDLTLLMATISVARPLPTLFGSRDDELLKALISCYLRQDVYQDGVIFDGLECSVATRESVARALRDTMHGLAFERNPRTHVVCLRVGKEEAIRRMRGEVIRCKAMVDDPEMSAAVKKIKRLPEKERLKLPEDALAKYNSQIGMLSSYEAAVRNLKRLSDPSYSTYMAQYYGGNPAEFDIQQPGGAPAAAASATGNATKEQSRRPSIPGEKQSATLDQAIRASGELELMTALQVLGIHKAAPTAVTRKEMLQLADEDLHSQPSTADNASNKETAAEDGEEPAPAPEPPISFESQDLDGQQECFKSRAYNTSTPEGVDARRAVAQLAEMIEAYIREPFKRKYATMDLKDPSWVPPPRIQQVVRSRELSAVRSPIQQFRFVERYISSRARPSTSGSDVNDMHDAAAAASTAAAVAAAGDDSASNTAGSNNNTGARNSIVSNARGSMSSLASQARQRRASGSGEAVATPVVDNANYRYRQSKKTRWVIPAHSHHSVFVEFTSPVIGRFETQLGFEIVGAEDTRPTPNESGHKEPEPEPLQPPPTAGSKASTMQLPKVEKPKERFSVKVCGVCALPTMAREPRSVFMRRTARRTKNTRLQYITAENVFDFGPLLQGKLPAVRNLSVVQLDALARKKHLKLLPSDPRNLRNKKKRGKKGSQEKPGEVAPLIFERGGQFPLEGDRSTSSLEEPAAAAEKGKKGVGGKAGEKPSSRPESAESRRSDEAGSPTPDEGDEAAATTASPSVSTNAVASSPTSSGGSAVAPTPTAAGGQPADGATEVAPDAINAPQYAASVAKTNCAVFRISNTGPFPMHVDLCLQNNHEQNLYTAPPFKQKSDHRRSGSRAGASKSNAAEKGAALAVGNTGPPSPVFIIEPNVLDLAVDESVDVKVWAFPQTEAIVEDVLVCSVTDNPLPVTFPIRCEGARPHAELSSDKVDFERLLIGQSATREVQFINKSSVAADWRLLGLERGVEGAEQFSVSPGMSGVLEPNETVMLTFKFDGNEQAKHDLPLSIAYGDAEGVLGDSALASLPIQLTAEAFKVDAKVELPDGANGLRFGTVRVEDAQVREVAITNLGLYDINVVPRCPSKGTKGALGQVLSFEPAELKLAPNEQGKILVTVKCTKALHIDSTNDLKLLILNAESREVIERLPLPVSVRSVYSRYRVMPAHGLSFGPVQSGSSKAQSLKIANEGEFPFDFRIWPADDNHVHSRANYLRVAAEKMAAAEATAAAAAAKGKKGATPAGPAEVKQEPAPDSLAIGAFTITPTAGSVPPGETMELTVAMAASNDPDNYTEMMVIDVARRAPSGGSSEDEHDSMQLFELSGESCSPGIETFNLRAVFEEQRVTATAMRTVAGALGADDPSLVGGRVDQGKNSMMSMGPACNYFAMDSKTFHFAPAVISELSRSKKQRTERFKIMNPFKVACNVNINASSAGEPGGGKDGGDKKKAGDAKASKAAPKSASFDQSAPSEGPFVITPTYLHLPSHEARYVTVTFNPSALRTYNATFEAEVEMGTDPATKSLSFNLEGEGTLPHVAVTEPTTRDEETAAPLVKFSRILCDSHVDRGVTMPITLRNEGTVPATARFDLSDAEDASAAFSFSGLGKMVQMDPGTSRSFDVRFRPNTKGEHSNELRISVLHNPFEITRVLLRGKGYKQDVTIDGLTSVRRAVDAPVDKKSTKQVSTSTGGAGIMQDELVFGDVPVQEARQQKVTLVNHSDFVYRFDWDLPPPADGGVQEFHFAPSIGHIQPGQSKVITVTFTSSAPRNYEGLAVMCNLNRIRYVRPPKEEKDTGKDSKASAAKRGSATTRSKTGKKDKPDDSGDDQEDEADLAEQEQLAIAAAVALNWDNTMRIARWATAAQVEEFGDSVELVPVLAGQKDPPGKEGLIQVLEMVTEPHHVPDDGKQAKGEPAKSTGAGAGRSDDDAIKQIRVPVSVTADQGSYECQVDKARFRPTMMYQTRVFRLSVRNTAATAMEYDWTYDPIHDSEHMPAFTIEPQNGAISPHQDEQFTISFSPPDALAYSGVLRCEVPHLKDGVEPLQISVSGQGQRPKCHFELKDSDYITGGRRAPDMPGPDGQMGPLAEQHRVMEFSSLGTNVRVTRRFFVVNPTDTTYAFDWKCVQAPSADAPINMVKPTFRCVTPTGVVQSGRKFEMIFEFTPTQEVMTESFWRFRIKDHDIDLPFLLVGSVTEPAVQLSRSLIQFNSILLGRSAEEIVYVMNDEHVPFSWAVDSSTFDKRNAIMSLRPHSGTVGPRSKQALYVTFKPVLQQEYNYTVNIKVLHKTEPVSFNVKGEGYTLRAGMFLQDIDLSESKPKQPHVTISETAESKDESPENASQHSSADREDEAGHSAAIASTNSGGLSGAQRSLIAGGQHNIVDFGVVHVRERRAKMITVTNQGKFPLDFQWDMTRSSKHVSLSPLSGSVPRGQSVECELSFFCKSEAVVEHLMAVCTFAGASKAQRFVLDVCGQGKKPRLEFSFTKHSFGPRFVASDSAGGMMRCCAPVTKMLTIHNKELEQNVAVDVRHFDTPHLQIGKDGRLGNTVLAAGEAIEVPITFMPDEVRRFRDTVHFEVNGLYTVPITLEGEGTPLRVELLNPSMASVDFGALRPGQTVVRHITLINRSRRAVECSLNAMGPGNRETARHTVAIVRKALQILPARSEKFTLAPKEKFDCELRFSPETQMSAFTQDVMFTCVGMTKPLLTVSGMCLGVGLSLHLDRLAFGRVVQNCSLSKKLQVSNVGDVGCRFDFQKIPSDAWEIHPSEGFLPAHGIINVDITFRPTEVGSNYNFEDVQCLVDGKKASGMSVQLSGTCVAQSEGESSELAFTTRVRRSQTIDVLIKNPSSSRWELKPKLENPFWSGESTIIVPPNGQTNYALTYRPLSMTSHALAELGVGNEDMKSNASSKAPAGKKAAKGGKASAAGAGGDAAELELPTTIFVGLKVPELPDQHLGSLFVPLPNGSALQYRLVGTSLAPEAEDKIEVEATTKDTHLQALPLRNWLDQYQRFRVIIENKTAAEASEAAKAGAAKAKAAAKGAKAGGDEKESSSVDLVRLTGADTIDIPAMQKRPYKLSYLTYAKGVTRASVTFLNEKSGEFMYFHVQFTAEKVAVMGELSLKAAIRQKVGAKVTVNNPFDVLGQITGFQCEDPAVHVALPVKVYPNSQEAVEVTYRPLVQGVHTSVPLTLECEELGEFVYTLHLDPPAAPAERAMRFQTALGGEQAQMFTFRSFSDKPTEYDCSVSGGVEFSCPAKVTAPAAPPGGEGVEVSVEVTFEPSTFGVMRDELTVEGKAGGGKYTCTLIGQAEPPKPRGPVLIAPGGTQQIKFKNVLADAETFDFTCDNPAFQVSKRQEKIARKAVAQISLSFKPTGKEAVGPNGSINAKLLVTCPSLNHPWVYYLEGLAEK